jgi:hypothetical protein
VNETRPARFRQSHGLRLFFVLLAASLTAAAGQQESVEQLKSRLASVGAQQCPDLCIQIAARQLDAAHKLYIAGESEQAKAAVDDVSAYSEQARDAAVKTGRRQKETEIMVRRMAYRLVDIKRAVSVEEQGAVQSAIERLQRVRDDLLAAMFAKKPKGPK